MDKKRRAIAHLIISGIIVFLAMSVYLVTFFMHETKTYEDKTLVIGDIRINYPYFADKRDILIASLINELATDSVDNIKYVVNYLGEYTNVLFKLYTNELITNYRSILFNNNHEVVEINELITEDAYLTEKMLLYIRAYQLPITNEELKQATKSYLFKEYGVEIYLTNYHAKGYITLIDLDYHEIKDGLTFPYELSKKYTYLQPDFKPSTSLVIPIKPVGEVKLVAFTFDDGPSKYTLDLLDLLDPFGYKATFFLVGYNIKQYNSIVLETVRRGHEVGNHTVDHARLTKLKQNQVHAKIDSNNELFHNITDKQMELLRPPYGAMNDKIKAWIEQPIILWSVDSRDWESRDRDKIVALVLKEIQAGDIVLFHDLYEPTIEAIKVLLPILYADNYRLVTVSDLFAANNITLEKGISYRHAR